MAIIREYPELEREIESFLDELDFDASSNNQLMILSGTTPIKASTNQIFSIKNTGTTTANIEGFLSFHYNNPSNITILVGNIPRDNTSIAQELSLNPVEVASIQVQATPSVLRSLQIGISKKTLWGFQSANVAIPSAFRDSKDNDTSLVVVPVRFILNGFVGLNFSIPAGEQIDFIIFVSAIQKNDALLKAKIEKEIRPGPRPVIKPRITAP